MDNPVPYGRLNPESPVLAYENSADTIWIGFSTGWKYRYTARSAGRDHVRRMIRLAQTGQGLGTYIAQHFRQGAPGYDRKEPFGEEKPRRPRPDDG